jgi:hypothetical protein
MDKQTKTLLMIGGGLAVLYYFKNRPTQNSYSGNGVNTNQGDYASGGGMGDAVQKGDMGGSGYIASGDDDTDSIANDPSTTYTGTISNVTKPSVDMRPIVGDKYSGLSAKPAVGMPDPNNKLPLGGKKLLPKKLRR